MASRRCAISASALDTMAVARATSSSAAGGAGPPGVLGMSPVDSFEQVPQLSRRDHDDPVRGRWPNEAASLQSLGVQRRAQAVMPKNLDQPATLAPKKEKIAGVGIALQSLLDS